MIGNPVEVIGVRTDNTNAESSTGNRDPGHLRPGPLAAL